MRIPKIAFTFWEGLQFTHLHLYTLQSLHHYNPDLEIRVYYSEKPDTYINTNDQSIVHIYQEHRTHHSGVNIEQSNCVPIHSITTIPNVTLYPIQVEQEIGSTYQLSTILRADIVRILKLYEHGGIWFDMDILFIKPLPDFLFSVDVSMWLFMYANTIPTGFLCSTPRNKGIETILAECKTLVQSVYITNDFQQFGPNLWIRCFQSYPQMFENCLFLQEEYIYPYTWEEPSLFFMTTDDKCTSDTFGIHWFNGHPHTRQFLGCFTNDKETIETESTVILKYLHKLLRKE
jgi:hypothetical protein